MSTKNLRPHRLAIRTAVAAALLSMLGASRAATFDVYARENSTAFSNNNISPAASPLDTGLSFVAGQTLTVTASGSWDGGCGSVVGPDGGGPCGDYMPGFPYYAPATQASAHGGRSEAHAGKAWHPAARPRVGDRSTYAARIPGIHTFRSLISG